MTEFSVKVADVAEESSDLLLLKYAQHFFGADKAVAHRLISAGLCTEADLRPRPGKSIVIDTRGTIAPKRVLFLGTPPLGSFTYDQMEIFALTAIEKIVELGLPIKTLTTTVHGTGYGLDGGEALQRLVQGFRKGLSFNKVNPIERITFLTLGAREERMLSTILAEITFDRNTISGTTMTNDSTIRDPLLNGLAQDTASTGRAFGSSSASLAAAPVRKKHVFVAMPFSEEFENVYEFGIYPAVRNCGLICERVDESHFAGDILARIRGGIEAADLVIADLTEGRPNVYLEVGYAWGKDVPVIFVAKKGEQLHFDVSTHKCIFYGKFTQFAKDLEALIRGIQAKGQN